MTKTELKIKSFIEWRFQKPKDIKKVWNNEYKGKRIKEVN